MTAGREVSHVVQKQSVILIPFSKVEIPGIDDEQRGIMILQLSQTPRLDLDSLLTIECQTGRIW